MHAPGADGHYLSPQPGQDQTSQRLSHSFGSDTSTPLFALYLQRAEDLAWKRYEQLKGDADQVLVFCGLFSAAVAALTVPLTPNFDYFLHNFDSKAPDDIFKYVIPINSLWFWSFLTSLFCATLALSLPLWARPKSMITSPEYSIPDQARLHALFAERFRLSFFIEALHGVVHVALCLFLVGLLLYFDSLGVSINVVVWYIFFLLVYIFFTVLPVFQPGSACSTPFSPLFAIAYAWVAQGASRLLYFAASLIRIRVVPPPTKNSYRDWNLRKLVEDKAQEIALRFDGEILERTLHMLRTDDDLEQFFDAIPGFCDSKIVSDPRLSLKTLGQQRLAEALIGFWNRTLSSNLVTESTKGRRLLVCMRAIEAANLAIATPGTLRDLSFRYLSETARSVELGHSLRRLRSGNAASLAKGIISSIISDAKRNDRWSLLAMDELGISRDVLQGYLAHGDSVLLANLIHITRHFFHGLLQPHPGLTREALNILPSVSKFDILNTLPELQHSFCALWNDVVRQAQSTSGAENNPFIEILLNIWGLYGALHRTTASTLAHPASYTLCEDGSHRNLTTHVQGMDGNTSGEASHQ